MRVMSYNIQVGWGKGLEAVAELVKKYDPDIVALQEVDRDRKRTGFVDQFKFLQDSLGLYGGYACAYQGPLEQGEKAQYGHCLFSKETVKVEKVHPLYVRDYNLPGEQAWVIEPRACLQSVTNGIRVFSLHFSTVSDLQRKQAEQIAQAVKAQSDLPVIVLGDFNNSFYSEALQPLNFLQNGLETIEPALSYPNGDRATDAIDHILLSSHFRVCGAQVVVENEGISDHNPIICDLEIK